MLSYRLRFTQEGFTLLEVLIASVILFSSIAVLSSLYSGALNSSDKAKKHIYMNSKVPFILNNISLSIKGASTQASAELNGVGELMGVEYKWHADLIESSYGRSLFSPESGQLEVSERRYFFWQVRIELKYESLTKSFTFKELSWI